MGRDPYAAHLCAQDPIDWGNGFAAAEGWVNQHGRVAARRVYRAIRDSSGRPWAETAASIGFDATAHDEGLALGIYGLLAVS